MSWRSVERCKGALTRSRYEGAIETVRPAVIKAGEIASQPLPNLAQDLIVPPLACLMPLELASKLFLVMVFGLIACGAIWLNRVATGAWRFWSLLAFLLLYNRIFLWGFVNYLFGI